MKTQSLLVEKRFLENRVTTAGLNEMGVVFRNMKSCGVSVEEFSETFPGNTFFDFIDRKRKLKRLRRRLNN